MANTQNLVGFFLVVILSASMFNTNILVSGGKQEDKIKYTYCTDTLCSDSYLPHMCFFDCTSKKFQTGTCIVPSPNAPLRCCCGNL
ncbi:hypothetical protein Bca4012_070219 [Brassica carinata]|uniref:Defensin-like domain-containing protein n=1 Tax=Brassica oleracea TaxID=3712 RepID=A0A3P6FGA8_BRAOL|nr:unnamed protein product [Brassica oleracea]